MTQVVDFPANVSEHRRSVTTRLKLRQNRRAKRRRIWWLRFRLLFRLVLLLAIIGFAYWFWTADFWRLKPQQTHVTIHGTLLTTGDVQRFTQPLTGKPLYLLNPKRLAAEFRQQHPVVHEIWFRRWLFPARLDVELVEQRLWASIIRELPSNTEDSPLVDGWLSDRGSWVPVIPGQDNATAIDETKGLLLVRIVAAPTPWLKNPDTIHRMMLLSQQLKMFPSLHLENLDARDSRNVIAHFTEVDFWLGTLDDSLTSRLQRLLPAVGKIIELKSSIDRVDLRWEGQLTFHKRSEPSAFKSSTSLLPMEDAHANDTH